jgi:hypothetical protein
MTEQTVDWARVERDGFRRNWLALLGVPAFFGAVVALTGRYAFWAGSRAWLVVAALVAFGLAMQAVNTARPRLRARAAESFRLQYALRHRIDPGPDLRGKLDRYARRIADLSWITWLVPFLPVTFLLQGRWHRPLVAVPAAVVLLGFTAAIVLWWRRQTAAGRRWVDDPPGPDRDPPPLHRWERRLSGRRLMWILLGMLVLAAVVPLVAFVVFRH